MISVRELSKSYGLGVDRIEALKNVHFDVKKGEIFGIIGKSGAGKSTLIRCLNLLEKPSSGSVLVNRLNLTLLSGNDLRLARRQIGMIFQNFNLLESRTVVENISFPLEIVGMSRAAIQEKVEPLLKLTDLTAQAHQFPSQLSGGQQQRVAIARSLANSPKVLLCDEATSSLDPRSTNSILELLKNVRDELGITIVLITHEMDVIKSICDRVAVLSEGEIIEQKKVIDLFTLPQTQVAKDFIRASSRMEIPKALRRILKPKNSGNLPVIVRVSYRGDSVSQPIIGFLIQQYRLNINIIQANIETVQNKTVGLMIVEISGESDSVRKGILFLERNDLHVEILGYVSRND